jgi:hypothetical protein
LDFFAELPAVPLGWFVGGVSKFKMVVKVFSFQGEMKRPI